MIPTMKLIEKINRKCKSTSVHICAAIIGSITLGIFGLIGTIVQVGVPYFISKTSSKPPIDSIKVDISNKTGISKEQFSESTISNIDKFPKSNEDSSKTSKETTASEMNTSQLKSTNNTQSPKNIKRYEVAVNVDNNRIGSKIFLNGKNTEITAPGRIFLEEGKYELMLKYENRSYRKFFTYKDTISVSGKNLTLNIRSDEFGIE